MAFTSVILTIVASLLAIPVAVFIIEIVAALFLPSRIPVVSSKCESRGRVAVLVPAHNETEGIHATLTDIKGQLRAGDRLLVVADNCSDDTAVVATAANAETIERNEPGRQGKGYALAFGIDNLRTNPPDIVIIIDADCRVASDSIDQLAATCSAYRRPAQAIDLMTAPDASSINYCVAEFAWRVKNWVRPLGLSKLNLPCQLMGTGMAFPWDVISSIKLASGSIVEDLKLGLELSRIGSPAVFCPSAKVTSYFPSVSTGIQSQRERWEKGHITTILSNAPVFFCQSAICGNASLLALTLDLVVPPLSLLSIFLVGMCLVSGVAMFFGVPTTAFTICAVSSAGFAAAVFLSWVKYGRDILPVSAGPLVASYVAGKLPIYRKVFSKSANIRWIRADRTKHE